MAKAGNCCTFCTFCTRSAPGKRGSGIRQGEKTPPLTLPLEGRGVIIVEKTPPLTLPCMGGSNYCGGEDPTPYPPLRSAPWGRLLPKGRKNGRE